MMLEERKKRQSNTTAKNGSSGTSTTPKIAPYCRTTPAYKGGKQNISRQYRHGGTGGRPLGGGAGLSALEMKRNPHRRACEIRSSPSSLSSPAFPPRHKRIWKKRMQHQYLHFAQDTNQKDPAEQSTLSSTWAQRMLVKNSPKGVGGKVQLQKKHGHVSLRSSCPFSGRVLHRGIAG